MTTNLTPGWYQHQADPNTEVEWDGTKWTGRMRPKVHSNPPPPPRSFIPPPKPPVRPAPKNTVQLDNINFIEQAVKWAGPLLILIGLITGLSFAVRENYITPPIQLGVGLVFSILLVGGGEWLTDKRSSILGRLITGVGFAGLFISAYSVAPIFDTQPNVTVFLSALAGCLALALSLKRNDSTMFALGIAGFISFPLSFWWNSRDISSNLGDILDVLPLWQITIPLLAFAGVALLMRMTKGWVLPWIASNIGLLSFSVLTPLVVSANTNQLFVTPVGTELVQYTIVLLSAIVSLWAGYLFEGRLSDNSPLQSIFTSSLEHFALPTIGLVAIPLIISYQNLTGLTDNLLYGLFAAIAFAASYMNISAMKKLIHQASALPAIGYAFGAAGDYYFFVGIALIGLVSAILFSQQKHWFWEALAWGAGLISSAWILFASLSGVEEALYKDLDMVLPAYLSFILTSISVKYLTQQRILWVGMYVLGLALILGTAGTTPIALGLGSLALVVAGSSAIYVGYTQKVSTLIWAGLITILSAAGKIILVDLAEANILTKAGVAIAAGIVLVVLSFNFEKLKEVLQVENKETPMPPSSLEKP